MGWPHSITDTAWSIYKSGNEFQAQPVSLCETISAELTDGCPP